MLDVALPPALRGEVADALAAAVRAGHAIRPACLYEQGLAAVQIRVVPDCGNQRGFCSAAMR